MAQFTNAYCLRNLTHLICIDKDNFFKILARICYITMTKVSTTEQKLKKRKKKKLSHGAGGKLSKEN